MKVGLVAEKKHLQGVLRRHVDSVDTAVRVATQDEWLDGLNLGGGGDYVYLTYIEREYGSYRKLYKKKSTVFPPGATALVTLFVLERFALETPL